MMLAIIISVFIVVFGGAGVMVYKTLKKTDPKNADTTLSDEITTAQEFLPFEDIKDGMMILGGHKYRAIIEASSINYNMKTDKEKELIEISFQRFLNSLTSPVTFFVQTKVMDNTKMLNLLEQEVNQAIKEFPQLEGYAKTYYDEMTGLEGYIGNNKQKKKYIIVPYEEAIMLPNLSEEEKYEYSLKELYTRSSILVDGLSSVGIKAHILDTKELAEVVYSTYHKDNYTQVENITSGEYLSMMVDSEKRTMDTLSEDAKLDWILYEAQMRLQTELLGSTIPESIKQSASIAIKELESLRDTTSGYYKQDNTDLDVE